MSDDLIRRRDAIDALKPIAELLSYGLQSDIASDIASALMSIPTIEPKRGEWVRTFDGNEWFWYCSNCKEQWYEDDLWMGGNEFPHFCPACGADMREVRDE